MELGIMNAECSNATLYFALIQHSAFHIPNLKQYEHRSKNLG